MKKKVLSIILIMSILALLIGCTDYDSTTIAPDTETEEQISYEAMLFDNQGNNYINFSGSRFDITPNKIKQWGYDSDGSWISFYETSSVVSVNIDGNYIQTCGSTVIFKDTRLEMLDIPDELETVNESNGDGYTVSLDPQTADTYYGLKNWWYDANEKGQHGKKIVLIQSQDGYNIGAFIGEDITWEVANKLPKTTKIIIDGLPLYIHRCNFTIIDSELMNSTIE